MNETLARREDVLVSLCFADQLTDEDGLDALLRAVADIDAHFRYWEVVLICSSDNMQEPVLEQAKRKIRNLRMLHVRSAPGYYRRRAIAAAEAIGDVVLLASIKEIDAIDLIALISIAADRQSVAVAARKGRNLSDPLVEFVGSTSRFHVTPRDLLTMAFPRLALNRLLAHPARDIALRFIPRDEIIPVQRVSVINTPALRRGLGDTKRRLGLLHALVVNTAPTLLLAVAWLSMLAVLSAGAFTIYAFVVWLTFTNVQPGWFSTSLVLTLTVGFLGIALFAVSMGIRSILDHLRPNIEDMIADEVSHLELFGSIEDLNVHVPEDRALTGDGSRPGIPTSPYPGAG